MGRVYVINLEGKIYNCKHCQTHLALVKDIVSRNLSTIQIQMMCFSLLHVQNFTCRHGKAYLFDKVVNVNVGAKEDRMMITGLHTVVDLFCVGCGAIVGWKYEFAHEKAQKYKVGKFILERYRVSGPDENNSRLNLEVAQANVSDDADDD
ncbi:protein yippee-like At3g55890 isoform X1 [Papaver somniferum]|uniref:protein yippee-like At3g55890 isoform X1 n=1 Tax=Papaver somniferum TaxID=3469 RepID=UPI000E6F7E7E|nr:protein yippee-like At3g55890 isoform X1 [Papaver somniferum]